jgi:hypothetical protein
VRIKALVLIETDVGEGQRSPNWDEEFELVRGWLVDEARGTVVHRPSHQEICNFVVAQTDWVEVPKPEETGISFKEAVEAARKAEAGLVSAQLWGEPKKQPLPDARKLAYHWLRISYDPRMKIALDLGLLNEDQLTSTKPLQLDQLIFRKAQETGAVPRLWEQVKAHWEKWGETIS